MGARVRILHLADSHIGAGLPARPRLDLPRRGDDLVRSYRTGVRRALEHRCDLLLHAGDVFDTPHPTQAALAAAAEPLLEVASAGIPVVIVPGNHERSVLPDSLLFSHPLITIIDRPATHIFNLHGWRVALVSFPCIRRGVRDRLDEALAATGWRDVAADVRIWLAHQTFQTAVCGPGNYRFRGDEDTINRAQIPLEFDYVAAGHVHRRQVLQTHDGDGPPVVYAGSCDRVSFAEVGEPKGCALVEIDADLRISHRWLTHDVRAMETRALDVTDLQPRQIETLLRATVQKLPERAYVRLRVSGKAAVGTLGAVGMTRVCRELRPDVLVEVQTQSVEALASDPARASCASIAADRQVRRTDARQRPTLQKSPPLASQCPGLSRTLFAAYHHPIATIRKRTNTRFLPARRGVYALFDCHDRLLYVGKATNLRSRVQSHARGAGAAGYVGWTRQISHIATCPADSDLEACLIEADLIRRHQPPFNRQMRLWSRYCYLAVDGREYGQLVLREAPQPGDARVFGPFRGRYGASWVADAAAALFGTALCPPEDSPHVRRLNLLCERYYAGACAGPCAGRIDEADYARRLAQRDALLSGENDAVLSAAEAALPDIPREQETAARRAWRHNLEALRGAHDHARRVREAAGLLNQPLPLPQVRGRAQKFAIITADGLRLTDTPLFAPPGCGVKRCEQNESETCPAPDEPPPALPRALLDLLLIARRRMPGASSPSAVTRR